MARSIKQIVLDLLSRDTYLSGQELSKELGVTRTTIWKHIQTLKKKGYHIESVPNLGYRLINPPSRLIPEEILRNLKTTFLGKELVYYDEIDSTNRQAKIHAYEYEEGAIFLANSQTGGRGRLGRQWNSQPEKGIWCSVLLKPNLQPRVVSQFPLLAAVAIVEVLHKYHVPARIKWPNDILVDGRKICGILTEMSAEADRLNYVIIGFGLNVKHEPEDFPVELQSIATSVEAEVEGQVDRVQLLCDILFQFEKFYVQFLREGFSPILDLWKLYNCTLGKEIKVSQFNHTSLFGKAIDIDSDGALVLKLLNGEITRVFSGEIDNTANKF